MVVEGNGIPTDTVVDEIYCDGVECVINLNNECFLEKDNELTFTTARNSFYDIPDHYSMIKVLFNSTEGDVKRFKTLDYEGTQAKTLEKLGNNYKIEGISVGQIYYDNYPKKGWYVEHMETDMQDGRTAEFINKENKWFNYIRGYEEAGIHDNLDTGEFSLQGLGFSRTDPYIESYDCENGSCFDPGTGLGEFATLGSCESNCLPIEDSWDCIGGSCVDPLTGAGEFSVYDACVEACVVLVEESWDCGTIACYDPGDGLGAFGSFEECDEVCGEIFGCIDPTACNYDVLATQDDGSCILPDGCTDAGACNYDVNAICDDGSCFYPDGCTDDSANNYDPNAVCDDGSCYATCPTIVFPLVPTITAATYAGDGECNDDGSFDVVLNISGAPANLAWFLEVRASSTAFAPPIPGLPTYNGVGNGTHTFSYTNLPAGGYVPVVLYPSTATSITHDPICMKQDVDVACDPPPAPPCDAGMDVAIIFDYTGSMGNYIEDVKIGATCIADAVENLSGSNDYRLSLTIADEYHGSQNPSYINLPAYTNLPTAQKHVNPSSSFYSNPIDQYITNVESFATNNVSTFNTQLQNLNTSAFPLGNGANLPEPTDMALNMVGNFDFSGVWRSGVAKYIILFTDALPGHDDDYYDTSDQVLIGQYANQLLAQNIKVIAIGSGVLLDDSSTPGYYPWQDLATITGGVWDSAAGGDYSTVAIAKLAELCGDVPGCMDASASNYNSLATVDDCTCNTTVSGCSFEYGFNLTSVNIDNPCTVYEAEEGSWVILAGGGDIRLHLNNLNPTANWHFEIDDSANGTSVYVGPIQNTQFGDYQTALPNGEYMASVVFDDCPDKGNSIPFMIQCEIPHGLPAARRAAAKAKTAAAARKIAEAKKRAEAIKKDTDSFYGKAPSY